MNSFEKFIAGTGILALSFLPLKSFGQTETNHQDTSKNPFYIRSGIGMKKFISSDIKKYPKFFPYGANLGVGFHSSKKSRIEISLNAYLGTKESKIESRNISAVSLELFYDLNLTSKAETISTYFGGGLKLEKINTYLTKNFEIFKLRFFLIFHRISNRRKKTEIFSRFFKIFGKNLTFSLIIGSSICEKINHVEL